MFAYNVTVARALYNKAVNAVLKTPLRYFDTTPQGRIINRLVKDTDTVDFVYGRLLTLMNCTLFVIVGMMITICVVAWPTIIIMVPTFLIYFWIFNKFRKITPQIKRLESASRAKVFSIC